MTLGSLGTLSGPVTFTVTGLPTGAACGFSPPAVTVQGTASPVTLRILTTVPVRDSHHAPWGWGMGALLAGSPLALSSGRRKRPGGASLLVLVVAALLGVSTACGFAPDGFPGRGAGTPVGVYEVTVTAHSAGATDAVSTLQLTVTSPSVS
jgi:hypothetical protein